MKEILKHCISPAILGAIIYGLSQGSTLAITVLYVYTILAIILMVMAITVLGVAGKTELGKKIAGNAPTMFTKIRTLLTLSTLVGTLMYVGSIVLPVMAIIVWAVAAYVRQNSKHLL
jgi:hypothetical protein